MNLWVKRTGQLLMVALFLMSCEDESYLLGFRNQNKRFNVRYHEIKFTGDQTSVLLIDSVISDHYSLNAGTYRFLIGQYSDINFGTVRAEAYTQFQPSFYSQLDNTGATYDSVTLQLQVDFYTYGFTGDSEEKFRIHRIMEDTLSVFDRYYFNSTFGYDPTPLGEITFDLDYFTMQKNLNLSAENQDTIMVSTRLDDEFGAELYLYASSYDSALMDNAQYREQFKGLVFVPSQNNYILGFKPSGFSRMVLHYHTLNDTLTRSFYFDPFPPVGALSFNNILTSRSGELASISQPYESYAPPSGMRYIQSGSPVITKLDLGQYYDFIRGEGAEDTLKNMLINSAELSIGIETPRAGSPPPSLLIARILKKVSATNYQFMNSALDSDSTEMSGFFLTPDSKYYLAASDVSQTQYVELVYDKNKQRYVGYLTRFLQNLFDRKSLDTEILYLGIYPAFPATGKTVNNVIFKQDNIKLGIYYTKPVVTNPQ